MAKYQQELVVRGEQIERLFINYMEKRYIVNRRYQRKLIWTLEEKQSFIDSIIKGYPVPIILLAEPQENKGNMLEIIDGMQRMNAVCSFISNDYSVNGCYYDLNTFATAKDLLDRGLLEQKYPIMVRDDCLRIAAYPLPLSIYEFAAGESIDEVFRRINSGGRQLSRQELRVAGATSQFSTCVRLIASKIRGDSSSSDIILLNDMKKISITNRELDYGINVEDVFWVSNGILTKDFLRQSRDEEVVADLIAYMISQEPLPSRTELLDDYYGTTFPLVGAAKDRFDGIDEAIRKRTPELVEIDFQRVHDTVLLILEHSRTSFAGLIFPSNPTGSPFPRYYQAIFLALHELIVKRNLEVSDITGVVAKLRDSGKNIVIQEGGRWGVDNRATAVASVVGWLQNYFEPNKNPDPAQVHWITKLENLLTNSSTEQAAYDFKQGFFNLSNNPAFDNESFRKVLETCAAIANIGKNQKGYVLVGISETKETANRVQSIFNVSPIQYSNFFITGIEHEARLLGKTLDVYFKEITDKIKRSTLSEPLRSFITQHLKCVKYYDKVIFVFEITGQDQPSLFDNKFFERRGPQVFELGPAEYATLHSRFR